MSSTYDLYVHERGRWILEGSFAAEERVDAMELARRIENHRSADGIQLIRERFDPDSGRIERSTVYNTWRRRRARAWREARGDTPGPYADVLAEPVQEVADDADELLTEPIYPDFDEPVPASAAPRAGPVIAKLMAIAFASLGLASLVTAMHSASAGALGF